MKKTINIPKLVLFFLVVGGFLVFALTFPYKLFLFSTNHIILNTEKYNELFANKFLYEERKSVLAEGDKGEELNEYVVKYKLFNLFDILSLRVKVSDNSVYLGGDCMGFSLKTKGLLVVGSNYVFTKNGAINPFINSGLNVGDVIYGVNGENIDGIDKLNEILKDCNGEKLKLDVYNIVMLDILVL